MRLACWANPNVFRIRWLGEIDDPGGRSGAWKGALDGKGEWGPRLVCGGKFQACVLADDCENDITPNGYAMCRREKMSFACPFVYICRISLDHFMQNPQDDRPLLSLSLAGFEPHSHTRSASVVKATARSSTHAHLSSAPASAPPPLSCAVSGGSSLRKPALGRLYTRPSQQRTSSQETIGLSSATSYACARGG